MKELQEQIKDKTEVIKPVIKQQYIGSIKQKPGHTCFQVDLISKEITVAEFQSIDANIESGVRKKLITKDNCIYVSALNKKNVIKQLKKLL